MTDQVRATTTEDKHKTTGRINKGRGDLWCQMPTFRATKKIKQGEASESVRVKKVEELWTLEGQIYRTRPARSICAKN